MADSNGTAGYKPTYPAGTIAKVVCDDTLNCCQISNLLQSTDILNETFHNIIHDLVGKVHREEKIARMRSAVTIARQRAEEEATVPTETPSKTEKKDDVVDQEKLANLRLETAGAIFDHGKVYLKGNPLQTTKQIICPECRLPRLLHPLTGSGSYPPADPNIEYCLNRPMIAQPGHDVHGKLAMLPNPKQKKSEQSPSPMPTNKCPLCPRYFNVTRIAAHMDRCLNARNKDNGTGSGSNADSPASSTPQKRAHAADDEDSGPSPTKKKKLNGPKKGDTKKPGPSKLKNSFTAESNDDDVRSENADA